ncbi:hypothetical protein J6S88_05050 [bacterium]|nr:hypothetical protein [bacterium]
MVQPYGPRKFPAYKEITFNNISIQNNYGYRSYGHRYEYTDLDTCGLSFRNRGLEDHYYRGYRGGYGFDYYTGRDYYGLTRKDYAKMYAFEAGANLLLTGASMWANYKYEKEANETPEEKETRLANEKQNEIERLRLTNPQTVTEGDNTFTYYYSQKTGYYYRYDASTNSFVRTKAIASINNGVIQYKEKA